MQDPLFAEVLTEAERTLREQGRAALCQIVRVEGSTPGKAGWKLLVRPDGSAVGNLGGGAFEALVHADARAKLREERPQAEIKRYYFTEQAVKGEATGMVCGGLAEVCVTRAEVDVCGVQQSKHRVRLPSLVSVPWCTRCGQADRDPRAAASCPCPRPGPISRRWAGRSPPGPGCDPGAPIAPGSPPESCGPL